MPAADVAVSASKTMSIGYCFLDLSSDDGIYGTMNDIVPHTPQRPEWTPATEKKKHKRDFLRFTLSDDVNEKKKKKKEKVRSSTAKDKEQEEHPLRTDEWELYLHRPLYLGGIYIPFITIHHPWMERLFPGDNIGQQRRQVMIFHRNGFVMLNENASSKKRYSKIGKWKLEHGNLSWNIAVKFITPIQRRKLLRWVTLYYHAEVHLNKFGEFPKMYRGVVVRDRFRNSFLPPQMLRPVIATFTARGIGKDTVDVTYKSRGFGLSQPQQTPDANGR